MTQRQSGQGPPYQQGRVYTVYQQGRVSSAFQQGSFSTYQQGHLLSHQQGRVSSAFQSPLASVSPPSIPPPPAVPPPPADFTFTNHNLIAGFNTTIAQWFALAGVPIVSAVLKSTFTLENAQHEGMLLGKSLAYLTTDTITNLNAYYPTIGVTELETEDSYSNNVLNMCEDAAGWKVDERFFGLGWRDLIFAAFFGSVKKAFLETKGRRAD